MKTSIAEALTAPAARDDLLRALQAFVADSGGAAPPPAPADPTAAGPTAADPTAADPAPADPGPADPTTVADTVRQLAPVAPARDTGASTIMAPLDTLLDSVREPILTVDRDGRVRGANLAAARVFAAAPGELHGADVTELLPELAPVATRLDELAQRVDDTFVDMAPSLFAARRRDGRTFTAETTVSAAARDGRCYVVCLRDVSGRLEDEQALRDSEARYRTLVENAPEAIVVLDVDQDRFVDANDNAATLFRMSREELLTAGLRAITPDLQSDGLPSFGGERRHIERALHGGRPVFEWLHRAADGRELPCEVRLIRLPSSQRRLIRASIMDITARRRADTLAYGERRVLELVAAGAPLERTLQAVVRLVEQLHPGVGAALLLLDRAAARLTLTAHAGLPAAFATRLAELPLGSKAGSCGAAASLGRQVVVRTIDGDPLFGELGLVALTSGFGSCCSTPIVTSGDRIHGTLAVYFDGERSPTTEELDLVARLTQLAGIAIRRHQDEQALRDSEGRFRGLFDNVVDGVFQITPAGEMLAANPALVRLLGHDSQAELAARGADELFVEAKDRDRLIAELVAYGRVRDHELRLKRRDGTAVVVLANARSVAGPDGGPLYFEGTVTDITARRASERALFNEKERAQVTLQSIGDAVVTTDGAGRIDYLNPVAAQLSGWERQDAAGRRIDEVVVLRDETTGAPIDNPVLRCLAEGRVVWVGANVVLATRDGATLATQCSAAPIRDRAGEVIGAVMVFHDASRERRLHRKLAYYASHDSLTGLINRREFEERLSVLLREPPPDAAVAAEPATGALLYLDLDQFKVVNDTCGHAAGDLLLRQLSEVLVALMPPGGVLARLGGDEFAVLLPDCTLARAGALAERLRTAVAEFRFTWRDNVLQVGASIGIVPVTAGGAALASVLAAADVACYVAKDQGRNRIHVYREGDAATRHQEMQWVARINRTLEQERFELYYQPIVPIVPRRDVWPHYELLLRMRDENGAMVAPNEFIPAAERYNLMPRIDRWVVTQAIESLVYRGDGEPYTLAVNLSGTTLSDQRFLEFLLGELSGSNMAPGALCFEITETAAIASLQRVVAFMEALKARGCKFALDDFGTGLSSLTYLKHLPVDYVKIDGAFVRNVTQDPADESVVEAIARMARAFRIETVAERVESRAVMKRLGELGVTFAQGFFVAVPQSVSELPVHAARRAQAG